MIRQEVGSACSIVARPLPRRATLIAVSLAALTALSCHRFTAEREVPPRMFVAATRAGGLIGIATSDSLEACSLGAGEARFLPLAGQRELAEDPWVKVGCADVFPLTPAELARVLDGEGGSGGDEEIPENDSPIGRSLRGYLRIPGEFFAVEYYLHYNEVFIRLVESGRGNHFGSELDHTYRVELADGRRAIRTVRSRERDVELD